MKASVRSFFIKASIATMLVGMGSVVTAGVMRLITHQKGGLSGALFLGGFVVIGFGFGLLSGNMVLADATLFSFAPRQTSDARSHTSVPCRWPTPCARRYSSPTR